jgi:phosphoserine aminotransferase
MAKRSGDRLYRKKAGKTFYGWFFDPGTRERVTVCTRTQDRQLAKSFLSKVERDAYAAQAAGRPAPHRGAATPSRPPSTTS